MYIDECDREKICDVIGINRQKKRMNKQCFELIYPSNKVILKWNI